VGSGKTDFSMNNHNQTKLPVMRTTGYKAYPALEKYEGSELTANPFSSHMPSERQHEVCRVKPCGLLWSVISTLVRIGINVSRAQSDHGDDDYFSRAHNIVIKPQTKYTKKKPICLESITTARQYLKYATVLKKLRANSYWSDPQLQGWAYNAVKDNCEAKLTIMIDRIINKDTEVFQRLLRLLETVAQHLDEKHSWKLQNIRSFYKIQSPAIEHHELRRCVYRAQSGIVENVLDHLCGYGYLMRLFHDISRFVVSLRRIPRAELIFTLYELLRSTTLESAFVSILKLLHRLNCTQVYLIMLGVSVAQISEHLKRRFQEKREKQPEFMAQVASPLSSWTELCGTMRNFSTAKRFATDVYDLLKHTPILSYLFDTHSALAAVHKEIPEWMADVSKRYIDQGIFKAGSDYNYSLEITEVMKKGLLFQSALQKMKVPQATMGAFNVVFRLAQEMARETKAFAVTPQARPEPLVIFMKGATGQGKSVLAQTIPVDLFKRLRIPYNPEVDYYRRNETQDHWDGYNHQKVVCFDDMLQSTDPQDLKTALLDFLHLKNELPYPLKMADLSAKSNTWFTSPLILITSNNDIERGPPIKSLGAIMRRRDIFVEVKIKHEFLRDGVADVDAITRYAIRTYGEITMCPEIYNFDLYSSGTEEVRPHFERTLTYEEFIDLAEIHWHKLHSKRSMIETYIKRQQGGVLQECDEKKVEMKSTYSIWGNRVCAAFHYIASKTSIVLSKGKTECRVLGAKLHAYLFGGKYDMYWQAGGIVIGGLLCALGLYYYWAREAALSESMMSGDHATKKVIRMATRFNKKKAESHLSGDQATKRVAVTRKFSRVRAPLAEGTSDAKASMVMQKLITTNMVRLEFRNNKLYGLMLSNNLLMAPCHILQSGMEDPEMLKDDEIFSIIKPLGGRYNFRMGDLDMIVDPEVDVAFMKMPKQCPSFPNIIHHFITDGELSKVNVKKLLMGACGTSETDLARIMSILVDGKFHGQVTYLAPHSEHKVAMLNIIRSVGYTAVTDDGDCGTLIAHMDPRVQNKILGFHVCAYRDQGHATIVTQEMIQGAMEELDIVRVAPLDLGLPCAQAVLSDQLMVIGGTPSGTQRYIPHQTVIGPSMFQGEYYDPVTAPADLTTRGGDSALARATAKNVGFEKPIPEWMLVAAANDVANMIMSMPSEYKQSARLLTISEAINGIEGDEYIRQIDVSTSPGYPYVDMKEGKNGKKGFLLGEKRSDGSTEYTPSLFLQEQLELRERGLVEGYVPPTFFMDTLKDERRPLEKVVSKNTRLFNVAPMDLNILLRRYCGKFIGHIMQNSLYGEISVGINPHSMAWKMLLEDLKTVGDQFIAGDYSKYDKRLPWQCISYVPSIIARFLGGYEKELDILIRSTFNGVYVSKDYSYFKVFGNPSGNTLTTIVNSVVNCMLVRVCYLYLGQNHQITSLERFHTHVKLKVFGDDNLMSVSDQVPWFDMAAVVAAMAEYGVEYGAATKDGGLYSYLTVEQITYLKRRFRVSSAMVFAPLPEEVIRETLNWVRRCPDEDAVMIQIIESAKKEWYHHGYATYEKEVSKLQNLADKHNLRLPGTTFLHWEQQFKSA